MTIQDKNSSALNLRTALIAGGVILLLLAGCGPSDATLGAVDYKPLEIEGDLDVSTPEQQGLDPNLVAELYYDAGKLDTLYSLLIIKNGQLIAEGYFNEGSVDQISARQSTTKSVTSALIGIALEKGCLTGVDQKMMDFFPELTDQISDPRKNGITIRHLLQMRAGYPAEEVYQEYEDIMFFTDNWHWVPHIVDFPLVSDPGTEFGYSNLTSHILAVIVARACDTDLMSFAQEHLFTPIGAEIVDWSADADGYRMGQGEIYVTARAMAKFGMLYFNDGEYNGEQIIPAEWVSESLERYSEDIVIGGWLTSRYGSFRDLGYGYQWWSARVGKHHFDYAVGHGANYIILLDDLDMIIVTTADPLKGPELAGEGGWKYEGAINNLVGDFIASLPSD
jgi:CubicO group peptidase (beta-lactamase class C family)